MKPHHLKPPPGARSKPIRKGRGESSGKGKTAGRGTKGTRARDTVPAGFEGGQMPLQRRLPKLPGFRNPNRVEYTTVNVASLEQAFDQGDVVDPDALRARSLIRKGTAPVKILGDGALSKSLTVRAHAFSAGARDKITASGGQVEPLAAQQR